MKLVRGNICISTLNQHCLIVSQQDGGFISFFENKIYFCKLQKNTTNKTFYCLDFYINQKIDIGSYTINKLMLVFELFVIDRVIKC